MDKRIITGLLNVIIGCKDEAGLASSIMFLLSAKGYEADEAKQFMNRIAKAYKMYLKANPLTKIKVSERSLEVETYPVKGENGEHFYQCGECDHVVCEEKDTDKVNYCPWCGANVVYKEWKDAVS